VQLEVLLSCRLLVLFIGRGVSHVLLVRILLYCHTVSGGGNGAGIGMFFGNGSGAGAGTCTGTGTDTAVLL